MLEAVLQIKILFTAVCWATPALLAPRCIFRKMGFPSDYPDLSVRLLGAAYLALLVGYLLGLQSLRQGIYPSATVWVGIVSNGAACAILAVERGTWRQWGRGAGMLMWISLVMTFLITTCLVLSGPLGH